MRALVFSLPFLLTACAAAPIAPAPSGAPRAITAAPVSSPDNARFLLAMAKDNPNALEIWRQGGEAPEWIYSWQDAEADDPASTAIGVLWQHSGRIDLTFSSGRTGVLMRDEEGWHLRLLPSKP